MSWWKSCCRGALPRDALLAAALAAAGCAGGGQEAPVVARVGGAALTAAELDNQLPESGASAAERRQFVDAWVRQQLLYQEALDSGVHQSARLQRLVAQAQRDLVVAAFLDQTFEDRQLEVSESDVEQYYRLHAEDYTRADAEVRAQHILVATRREATALRQDLIGGYPFEEKARELSLDRQTQASGGDLGYFTEDDYPELWDACARLGVGEVSGPVATEAGFHLVRLLDRKESGTVRDLEEVRGDIVEALVRERHHRRLEELVEGLKKKHSWMVAEDRLAPP